MIDRTLNYGRHIIRKFLQDSQPYRNVLDLGAGTGLDLESARSVNPSAALYAIEFHEPNIAQLKNNRIEVHTLDIERDILPFHDQSLDVVIANQLLEHTKEIFWIFHEISRILKVGGHLIIGVPNLASFHNRILLLMGRQPTPIQVDSAHIRGFTKSGLLNFMNIYRGFSLIDYRGSNFYPFPPFLAKALAHMFPSFAWGSFFNFTKKHEYQREFLKYPLTQQLETNYYRGPEGIENSNNP